MHVAFTRGSFMTPSKLRQRMNNHEQCESQTFSMIPDHERVQHTNKVRVVRVEIKASRTRDVTGILPSSILLHKKLEKNRNDSSKFRASKQHFNEMRAGSRGVFPTTQQSQGMPQRG